VQQPARIAGAAWWLAELDDEERKVRQRVQIEIEPKAVTAALL
jgi:hypothetical protein